MTCPQRIRTCLEYLDVTGDGLCTLVNPPDLRSLALDPRTYGVWLSTPAYAQTQTPCTGPATGNEERGPARAPTNEVTRPVARPAALPCHAGSAVPPITAVRRVAVGVTSQRMHPSFEECNIFLF